MDIPDNLLCLFNAQIEERGDTSIIEVPEHEVEVGDLAEGERYRIAVFADGQGSGPSGQTARSPGRAPSSHEGGPEPPVETGDEIDVEIEDVGDQGDGIARVGPGYVIIVPGAELGERVSVEITEVRENMAFAEIVESYDR